MAKALSDVFGSKKRDDEWAATWVARRPDLGDYAAGVLGSLGFDDEAIKEQLVATATGEATPWSTVLERATKLQLQWAADSIRHNGSRGLQRMAELETDYESMFRLLLMVKPGDKYWATAIVEKSAQQLENFRPFIMNSLRDEGVAPASGG